MSSHVMLMINVMSYLWQIHVMLMLTTSNKVWPLTLYLQCKKCAVIEPVTNYWSVIRQDTVPSANRKWFCHSLYGSPRGTWPTFKIIIRNGWLVIKATMLTGMNARLHCNTSSVIYWAQAAYIAKTIPQPRQGKAGLFIWRTHKGSSMCCTKLI